MPGVPREVIEHHLAVCPQAHPVKQKTRKQAHEKQDFIVQEIEKLKKAKLIREVAHPTWIANPVVIPKSNGSGRLCVDFTSLNKAYPKDPYPLPRIDKIIDSTTGCDLLCILDAFSGYHQIKMAIDKFTKWVEVEPVCTIPARSVVKFIRGLVCRFGVPNRIIADNGSQFTSGLFWEYCSSAGIKICFASVAYPRSNGQAERANAEVLKGLKTRSFNAKLEACGKKWLDNLQSILWSIRTTATKSTRETPFFLVYGAEAFLPTDVKFGSPRVLAFNEIRQEDLIKDDLLQLEEARCQAALRTARYQQGLRRYHSRHVWARTLEVGDLVLRRILSLKGLHKLSPMWEGPFKVTHITRPGSARLETAEGVPMGNPWNIAHLRKFYP
jgi:hypothetical protein